MSGASGRDGPSGDTGARASSSRPKMWLLLHASRPGLAVAMVGLVLVVTLAVDASGLSSLTEALDAGDPAETLFQALVGAIITGVTLVVTLSQLVLSQELGAVGDQWERMQAAMEFRERVEEQTGVPSAPPEPAAFLRSLVDVAGLRARHLVAALGAEPEGRERRVVSQFAHSVIDDAEAVGSRLEGAHFGTFAVVSGALEFDYSWRIHQARRILGSGDVDLDDDARGALEGLLEALTLFGPAREHFKTLYFEWELINLSRGMVYLAVPALAVSVISLLYLEVSTIPAGWILGASNVAWVVGIAVSIAASPFLMLLSYILRIVTVAKLTLAMGPFILRGTGRGPDVDVGT